MRPPIYDVYQMKADRLPEGTKAVWLRTWPDERPASDDWTLIGRERHPSKWTIDELNKFLTNPQGYIPGVNMRFVGLPRDNQRADVIDFLNTLSDNPQPLPVAKQ